MTCALHLPDGATVSDFAADVYDVWASGEISCSVQRIDSTGTASQMASTPGTGVVATPGWTTLADDSIVDPVIDNLQYAYSASCTLESSSLWLAKVSVGYVGAP